MPEPKHNKGRSKQDYVTPDEFIAAVLRKYRIAAFDCDLAASAENTKAPLYYDQEQNSLVQPWKIGDGWNWCNPPFANIEPWVAKAWHQWNTYGARTLMLLPAGIGSNWFRDYVYQKAYLTILNDRIHFVGSEWIYPKDCILLEYSDNCGTNMGSYSDIEIWSWQS